MILKLSWRNLWRNRRRTFITMGSVFFAVVLATLMMSMKEGMYVNMIRTMVGDYTGYVQVHTNGYWDDPLIDNVLTITDSIDQQIAGIDEIENYLPRVESFALAASDSLTNMAMVVGIDPELEQQFNNLKERVSDGEYFSENDRSVLLGSGLAEYLKVEVGDTLVLLGQGYHGASAAGKYPVKGLVKFGSPELSKKLVFLPLAEAQFLYDVPNMCTSLILQLKDPDDAATVATQLGGIMGNRFEVMTWEELLPEMKNMIETDRVEGYVFMFILYLVISFGIFGTMLMMMAERRHEFGVLVAVGMKRFRLASMVWIEVIFISLMGAFAGMLGALPVCIYFNLSPIRFGDEMGGMMEEYGIEPILQAYLAPDLFLNQALVVATISSVITIYPFVQLLRFQALKAMRS